MSSGKPETATGRGAVLASLVLDLLMPIAVYYGARSAGADPVPALLLAAIAPAAHAATTLLRHRAVEWLSVLVLAVTLISAATATLSGSPRFLLAKDGAITAALGIAVLASARSARPALYAISRSIVVAAGHDTNTWDERWETSATFRHLWRVLTIGWAAGLLLDAVLRAIFAYGLPVDTVPIITAIQWIVLVIALNALSQVYLRRPAHRHLVFDPTPPDTSTNS